MAKGKNKNISELDEMTPDPTPTTITVNTDHFQQEAAGSVKIEKAEIKGETLYAEYSQRNEDNSSDSFSREREHLIHRDLKDAFKKLVPHLIISCDQKGSTQAAKSISTNEEMDEKYHEEYSVFAYQVKGDNVTLFGTKNLTDVTGVLKLKSPEICLSRSYQYANELDLDIQGCNFEVQEYFNGKQAAEQQSLDFGDEEMAEESAEK